MVSLLLKPSFRRTITFHAEINFDSVLPSGVKLQYAAAMDTVIKRPHHLAINYKSDLGAKMIWYDGTTLTIYGRVFLVGESRGDVLRFLTSRSIAASIPTTV